MKRKIIIELIWLVALLVLSVLIYTFVPGIAPFDINMHDTYIVSGGHTSVVGQYSYLGYLYIVIVFFAYLLRCLYQHFCAVIPNFGLLISSGLLLFSFSNMVPIITLVPGFFHSNITHEEPVTGLFYGGSNLSGYMLIVDIIKIALILIFAFTAFMIGRNWKKAINVD